MHKRIAAYALAHDISINSFIEEAVEEKLARFTSSFPDPVQSTAE